MSNRTLVIKPKDILESVVFSRLKFQYLQAFFNHLFHCVSYPLIPLLVSCSVNEWKKYVQLVTVTSAGATKQCN